MMAEPRIAPCGLSAQRYLLRARHTGGADAEEVIV